MSEINLQSVIAYRIMGLKKSYYTFLAACKYFMKVRIAKFTSNHLLMIAVFLQI